MAYRTKRYFDGTALVGRSVSALLPSLLVDVARKMGNPRDAVFQEWSIILGEKMAPWTEPTSLLEGVLTVKVKSSTLYSVLCQHEKLRLLGELRKKFSIRDIVFRIG